MEAKRVAPPYTHDRGTLQAWLYNTLLEGGPAAIGDLAAKAVTDDQWQRSASCTAANGIRKAVRWLIDAGYPISQHRGTFSRDGDTIAIGEQDKGGLSVAELADNEKRRAAAVKVEHLVFDEERTLPEGATLGYIECTWTEHPELGRWILCRAFLPGRTYEFANPRERDFIGNIAQFLAEYAPDWCVSAAVGDPAKDLGIDVNRRVLWLAPVGEEGEIDPERSLQLATAAPQCGNGEEVEPSVEGVVIEEHDGEQSVALANAIKQAKAAEASSDFWEFEHAAARIEIAQGPRLPYAVQSVSWYASHAETARKHGLLLLARDLDALVATIEAKENADAEAGRKLYGY